MPLPAQRAALSLLSYNKGAIFMGSEVLLESGDALTIGTQWNALKWSGVIARQEGRSQIAA